MQKIIDFKSVELTESEFEYYERLVKEFTIGAYSGKEQFKDLFTVDEDGCISEIHPPMNKELSWAVLFFVQNLMINQRLRRMERKVENGGK